MALKLQINFVNDYSEIYGRRYTVFTTKFDANTFTKILQKNQFARCINIYLKSS